LNKNVLDKFCILTLRRKGLFPLEIDLNLSKKLVKCYIWSTALYGAVTWTLRKLDQKYLESFEILHWRRMEIICTDRARNEEVSLCVKGDRNSLHTVNKKKGKMDW
jgi:hypothetical protein